MRLRLSDATRYVVDLLTNNDKGNMLRVSRDWKADMMSVSPFNVALYHENESNRRRTMAFCLRVVSSGVFKITSVSITLNTTDITALASCTALETLYLSGCTGITDITALAGCAALKCLALFGCAAGTSYIPESLLSVVYR